MRTLISTPETFPGKAHTAQRIGFHPTKKGGMANGYAMMFGEKNKTSETNKENLGLTTVYVSDKVVEQVQNITSPNQVATLLRGIVGCHRQKIDTIMRRSRSHI